MNTQIIKQFERVEKLMAQIAKISEYVPMKCSAKKFYEHFKNMDCLPRLLPQQFKSYKILQGNGFAHGSIVHWKFDFGKPTEVKERLAMDDANKSICIECLEGDIFKDFEVFNLKIQAVDNDSYGSSANWSIEFVKANEHVVPPYDYLKIGVKISKAIDAYLCNN